MFLVLFLNKQINNIYLSAAANVIKKDEESRKAVNQFYSLFLPAAACSVSRPHPSNQSRDSGYTTRSKCPEWPLRDAGTGYPMADRF